MADYKLIEDNDSNIILFTPTNLSIPNIESNPDWQSYLAWKALGNTPDPQYTTEEQAQIDYQERQSTRIRTLTQAVIDQFEMILSLYQVGRDNGVWVNTDFPEEVRAKALEWRALIDEYNNDAPGA